MGKLDDFVCANLLKRINRVVQIVCAVTFIVGLNYVATLYYERIDLTSRHLFSLSPETLAHIEHIQEPIEIIVTIPSDSSREDEEILYRYTRDLINEYVHAARRAGERNMIRVEYIDIFKDIARAEALARDHAIDQPNLVLVRSGNRSRTIVPSEILEFERMRPVAFMGERALTSAMIEVGGAEKPDVYFLVGYGEMRIDDVSANRGLSEIAAELRARNIAVGSLELSTVDAVPEEADLLILPDPMGPLRPEDVEKIRNYLVDRAGRLIALIAPARRHGLDDLFHEWGIRVEDMIVVEGGSDYIEGSGNYLVRQFGEHPVTEVLIRNQTPVITGLSRPVRQVPGAALDGRLSVIHLLGSSPQSWAMRRYRDAETSAFNPATDLEGPVPIAAVAERKIDSRLGISYTGGRVMVFGTADLFSNRLVSSVGNHTLFFSAVNWSLDRDQLLAIPPRPIEKYRLTLSRSELLQAGMLFLIPAGVLAVIGLLVGLVRRY